MRIQQISRLITIGVVVLSVLAILCALMARRMRLSPQMAYECREAPAASEDFSI
jgi:hypothetical protein